MIFINYTEEEMLEFVRTYYLNTGFIPSHSDLKCIPDVPGFHTYRSTFITWSNVIEKALGIVYHNGIVTTNVYGNVAISMRKYDAHARHWQFSKTTSNQTDINYYLCIGVNPMYTDAVHIYFIPTPIIVNGSVVIYNSSKCLEKWKQYEISSIDDIIFN